MFRVKYTWSRFTIQTVMAISDIQTPIQGHSSPQFVGVHQGWRQIEGGAIPFSAISGVHSMHHIPILRMSGPG
jgi:hypothetical protein